MKAAGRLALVSLSLAALATDVLAAPGAKGAATESSGGETEKPTDDPIARYFTELEAMKLVDVVVPATYRQEGASQVFEGALPIKRTVFNIGDGEWKDTSVVADDVQIKFRIVLAKK